MSQQVDCPKCGNKELKKGIIRAALSVVHMFPENNPRSKSSPISSIYCKSCGYILESYIDHPERLED
ncbi:PF20097 family protein [Virgibacillus necropolis]|uniref:acetyltransferase n=1 Tax=Virgibacillus necropolis TaxID=163877 RepID=UPI00384C894B